MTIKSCNDSKTLLQRRAAPREIRGGKPWVRHLLIDVYHDKHDKDQPTLMRSYKSYVLAVVECFASVFSPCQKIGINLLESGQNDFIRKRFLRWCTLNYDINS